MTATISTGAKEGGGSEGGGTWEGEGKRGWGIQKSENWEKRTEGYSLYTILPPRYD